jgi:hypothetical protein
MRVLAVSRYDRDAASTHYRLLQSLPSLAEAGIEVEWHPLMGDGHMKRLGDGQEGAGSGVAAADVRRIATSLPLANRISVGLWRAFPLFAGRRRASRHAARGAGYLRLGGAFLLLIKLTAGPRCAACCVASSVAS